MIESSFEVGARLCALEEKSKNLEAALEILKEKLKNLEELLKSPPRSDPVVESIPVIFDTDNKPENEIISDLLKQAKALYPQPVVFRGYLTTNAVAYLQHSCSVSCIVDPVTMENIYRIKYEMGD